MALRTLKPIYAATAVLILIAVAVRVASTPQRELPHIVRAQVDVPQMDYSPQAGGCGNIFLFKQAGGEVLSVHVHLASAQIDLFKAAEKKEFAEATFDLAVATKGLQVEIELWDGFPRFCDCIAGRAKKTATWMAKKGKLTITIHGPAGTEVSSDCYLASALLEDVVFEDDRGRQVTLKKEAIKKVAVGWMAG